ncbi:unnamed protein product [Rhizophagus irregularis]|uniref:ATPase domain-containing protein n=1 Tax=Rhizophagus irregularis TaxID=588596 RepID=A0A2I1EJV4_9GLOM|nr:hypothetical protein RhiirB3_436342 [Rhizophagus irregularis]CAB4488445.1 unnamed protein product [Rhizophagus irregularis]CAB5197640.1 unnamed protein product [Rhizophagus irregularis]CAB5312596.1 unnamed protein product [Rhizophagus irregularis]
MSFVRAHYFHRNILPSRQISFLQPPKIILGKSNSHFLRLSQLKSFTKSVSTSSSSLQEGINPIFTAYPFITFFSSLMLVDLIYTFCQNKCTKYHIIKTFENGNQPKVEISHSKYLSRSEMIDQLKNIFNPHEDQSFYHIIYGINGIGKSTLVKTASKEVGQGVIYVEIPASVYDLNEAFAKALNMSPNKFTFTNRIARSFLEGSKEPELKQYLEAIKYGAEVYKRKHGKPPVIIYDNVDHLVAKHSKILDLLQNDAKKSADDKKYITVFVSGKNSTFNKMYSNKHIWPHAKKLVMEIGELSKEESMNYLVNKRGIKTIKEGRIDTTEAEKLYELVGGNIRDLSNVADKFLNNASFEDIKQHKLNRVFRKFCNAKLNKNQVYHKAGKNVIEALLYNNKMLDYLTYRKFFNNPDEADEVLEANVFAHHPEKHTVTFESRVIERYVQENAQYI